MNLMRGIAAVAVVVFHAHVLLGGQLAPGGYLAVDFFFLMSGFVIAHAYDRRLRSGLMVTQFVVARLIRFLPFYLVGLGLGVALELLLIITGSSNATGIRELVWITIIGLAFLPFLKVGHDIFPLNIPSWSLHHEFVVNVLYAVFHRHLTLTILGVVACVAGGSLLLGIIQYGDADSGPLADQYGFALARAAFSFSAGVLIYRVRPAGWMPPWLAMLSPIVVFLLPIPAFWRPLFDALSILVLFPMVLVSLAEFQPRSLLFARASTLSGDLSYPLYALHYPLIWLVRGLAAKLGWDPVLCGITLIGTLVLACGVIERRVELPIRKRMSDDARRLFTRRDSA